MFFLLAKILGFFALPSNILISLGLLGAVLMTTRFAPAGRRVAVASLVLIAIAGLSPLGNAIILPLEERFPPWDAARGAPIGIISLGGAFDTVVSPARGEVALNEAAERLTAIAELARRFPHARQPLLKLAEFPQRDRQRFPRVRSVPRRIHVLWPFAMQRVRQNQRLLQHLLGLRMLPTRFQHRALTPESPHQ